LRRHQNVSHRFFRTELRWQTLLLTLLLAQSAHTGSSGPQSTESVELGTTLQAPVHSYSVTANTFVDALIEVAGRFKFPIGIVWVRKTSELKPIHISWSDARVEKALQDIVHAQPGYEVELRNAVMHVRPRDMIPDKENFLSLRVSRFEVHKEVAETASTRLAELVNLEVTPPKPAPVGQAKGGIGSSQLVEVGDPEISISLADVTVEDALDAISLASPFKVWIVTFAPAGDLTPTGFRRTVSPIASEAVPHPAKPYWELLRWGRAPY